VVASGFGSVDRGVESVETHGVGKRRGRREFLNGGARSVDDRSVLSRRVSNQMRCRSVPCAGRTGGETGERPFDGFVIGHTGQWARSPT